jgi:hypothetical protein
VVAVSLMVKTGQQNVPHAQRVYIVDTTADVTAGWV